MILNLTVFFYFAPEGDGADSCLQYIRNASDDAINGVAWGFALAPGN